MSAERLRIYVVDDHPVVRRGLRTLLDSLPDVEVVGEASNGEEAVVSVTGAEPDVVVMDLNLPGMNGIDATRRLVNDAPHLGVLVLTMFEDDESVFAAIRAGARGYVLKGADQDDLVRAVLAVGRGEAIFGPSIAARITRFFSGRPAAAVPFPDLTEREREILELLARGHSNIEVSRHLCSAKTVRNHVSNIFTKLQVTDRTNAVIRARAPVRGERIPGDYSEVSLTSRKAVADNSASAGSVACSRGHSVSQKARPRTTAAACLSRRLCVAYNAGRVL